MDVQAPAVVKLFGEHAVVYDKLAVAAAINLVANASLTRGEEGHLTLDLPNFNEYGVQANEEYLRNLFKAYKEKSLQDFLAEFSSEETEKSLPLFVIAARLAYEHGVNVFGRYVSLDSEIPKSYGLASSAAICTAFTVSLINADTEHADLTDEQIIDVARDGERIIHRNPNAGGIDVSASYYGGVVSFKKSRTPQAVPHKITGDVKLSLIDSGPKTSTAEMVARVRKRYDDKETHDAITSIFEEIDRCSIRGLHILETMDLNDKSVLAELGSVMDQNQNALSRLGVSSERFDKAIRVANLTGAYGAKLSGGGGGGIALALMSPENSQDFIAAEDHNGFDVQEVEVTQRGAKSSFRSKSRN